MEEEINFGNLFRYPALQSAFISSTLTSDGESVCNSEPETPFNHNNVDSDDINETLGNNWPFYNYFQNPNSFSNVSTFGSPFTSPFSSLNANDSNDAYFNYSNNSNSGSIASPNAPPINESGYGRKCLFEFI